MSVWRVLLTAGFFVFFGTGGALLGIILFPLMHAWGTHRAALRRCRALLRAAYRLFVWAARVTGLFRVELSADDRRRLTAIHGSVIVANHVSLLDIVVMIAVLGDTTAIAKAPAARNPFYAHVVRRIFLVNDDPQRVCDEAAQLLSEGVNLIVFPEGTRGTPGAPTRPLRRGAAQLACAAQAPVVPVRLTCTPPVLAKDRPWYALGTSTTVFTLTPGPALIPPRVAPGRRHSAAVALTAAISEALFGARA